MSFVNKIKDKHRKLLFIDGQDGEISLHPTWVWGPSYIVKSADQKKELSDFMVTFKLIFLGGTFVTIMIAYLFGNYICLYLIGLDRFLAVWPVLALYLPAVVFWLNKRLSHLEKQSYLKGAAKMLEHVADHHLTYEKIVRDFVFFPFMILLIFVLDTIGKPEDHQHYYFLFVIAPILILEFINRSYMMLYKSRSL